MAPQRLPIDVAIPTEFSLMAYDACKQWGALDWYKALYTRSLMRFCNKYDRKDGGQSYKRDAMSFILNPLIVNNFNYSETLTPICNQTVQEFFRGNDLVRDDYEYSHWYECLKKADKLYTCSDEIPSMEESFEIFTKIRIENAWEMHRLLNPPLPLQLDERFMISVDLNAPDDYLIDSFKAWLKSTRDKASVPMKIKIINPTHFDKWLRQKYLPYLDLSFWAEANQVVINQQQYLSILFNGFSHDATKISDVKAEALALLSDTKLAALRVQAYHYK